MLSSRSVSLVHVHMRIGPKCLSIRIPFYASLQTCSTLSSASLLLLQYDWFNGRSEDSLRDNSEEDAATAPHYFGA